MVERMLRSAAVFRALFVPGVIALGVSACAPESASDAGTSAGSSATQTGSSQIGGAGVSAGAAGQSPAVIAAGRPATVGSGGAGSVATAGASAPNTMVGAAGKAAIGGSPATGAGGAGAAGKPAAGTSGGAAGMSAAAGAGASDSGNGETGRMVGITEAHNVVRARLMNPKPEPALPPLKWSPDIAKVAQAYAEKLASGGNCLNLVHSQGSGFGENLAGYQGTMVKPADVVEGWAAEEECYKFGPISSRGEDCDSTCAMEKHSNGCGHYTQVVWRGTTEVGCGMATCGSGRSGGEVWVCNYKAPGNFIGMEPY